MTEDIYDSSKRRTPLIEEVLALIEYKGLIRQLVSRSIKTRYKRSLLGVAWTLLNPLLTMVVLTVVFSQLFRFDIEYYPIYILSGLVVWNFFSSTTQASMGEMIWSGALINRIYMPKSAFPVSAVGTGLVNLGLSLIPLVIIALAIGINLNISIVVLPLATILLAMFTLGVGLILAVSAVYFADMLPVYDVILTIWMYATPIIYPVEIIPSNWQWLFRLNPIYQMILLFRAPLYEGTFPDVQTWVIATLYATAALILGGLLFTSKTNEYAYRI